MSTNQEMNSNQNPEGKENQESKETKEVNELKNLKAQLEDEKNKYLYLYAEFENYKKRAIKERSDLLKYAHEPLLKELLQVLDNFERAIEAAEKTSQSNSDNSNKDNAILTGIKMVYTQALEILSKFGVQPIKSIGESFDPEKHEALAQTKVDNDNDNNKVLIEHLKGYTYNGRLLRPAKVTVGKTNI